MTTLNDQQKLQDSQLDQIVGGLLLPAVQAAREAARRQSPPSSHDRLANVETSYLLQRQLSNIESLRFKS